MSLSLMFLLAVIFFILFNLEKPMSLSLMFLLAITFFILFNLGD